MKKHNIEERTTTTDYKLKQAFIELYKTKPVDCISVKEITTLAGLNRGTFYIYYQNVHDLLNEIEYELISDMKKLTESLPYKIITNDPDSTAKLIAPLFAYIKEKQPYFTALLGEYSLPSFRSNFISLMKTNISKKFKIEGKNFGTTEDYILEYFASANIGIITYWIESGMKISSQEILTLLGKLLCVGVLNL